MAFDSLKLFVSQLDIRQGISHEIDKIFLPDLQSSSFLAWVDKLA